MKLYLIIEFMRVSETNAGNIRLIKDRSYLDAYLSAFLFQK